MIDFKTIAREAWDAAAFRQRRRESPLTDADFQAWWAQRMRFTYGARVRFKVKKRGRTMMIGRITNHPGPNAVLAYVVWPNAWAGHVHLSEIEVVP